MILIFFMSSTYYPMMIRSHADTTAEYTRPRVQQLRSWIILGGCMFLLLLFYVWLSCMICCVFVSGCFVTYAYVTYMIHILNRVKFCSLTRYVGHMNVFWCITGERDTANCMEQWIHWNSDCVGARHRQVCFAWYSDATDVFFKCDLVLLFLLKNK